MDAINANRAGGLAGAAAKPASAAHGGMPATAAPPVSRPPRTWTAAPCCR
ncbi:hypothetical protein WJ972_15045 [Achromobacter insuavis]